MFTDSRGYSFSDWQWTQTKQDSCIVPQLLATNEQLMFFHQCTGFISLHSTWHTQDSIGTSLHVHTPYHVQYSKLKIAEKYERNGAVDWDTQETPDEPFSQFWPQRGQKTFPSLLSNFCKFSRECICCALQMASLNYSQIIQKIMIRAQLDNLNICF